MFNATGGSLPRVMLTHGGVNAVCSLLWRIVLLTEQPDDRFAEAFEAQASAGGLPGFLEIYLARDLGVALRRTR